MRKLQRESNVHGSDTKEKASVLERAKLALFQSKAAEAQKRAHKPLSSVRTAANGSKLPSTECCASDSTKQDTKTHRLSGKRQRSDTQSEAVGKAEVVSQSKPPKPLTEFEKVFGRAEDADRHDAKENERMQTMAGHMEWSLFSSECKTLAEQERVEDRMANVKEMKVSAFHCKTCNSISESRRPRCAGHEVKQVKATKRWFQCGGCAHRTASVARRFPAWRCDRCRMEDWQPCSMYIIGKDRVAEVQNELYGYGDRELLKISGPDFDTRL
eukprot:jgi/Ulvmu1/11640/UM008_0044.1